MYSSDVCGRYALHASPEVIALQFGLDGMPQFRSSYNISPGGDVLAVRAGRVAALHHWGLAGHLANVRAETIEQKFAPAFRERRCLVPASGYYEWQASAGRKHPWYLRPLDAPLFALAAIAAPWRDRPALALVTTAPNALASRIHDRMPAIIAPESYEAWLDPGYLEAGALLAPYAVERMQAHPVSARVNRSENDGPTLIEPGDEPPQRDLL